ncbi:hypothetical protein SAMN05216603_12335 [Pseudomonas benzenivorans]|nr:hypothetical protein [Pseudomonas benzenivorans]SDI15949.1 hypothetical protein SAMN05216603_12335 [Pseudomonas benzenivorans]
MPLYAVSTRTAISAENRSKLAKLIMDVHCGITGAPETFVNVMFMKNIPLRDGISLHIVGGVRKGRTSTMNEILQKDLKQCIAELMIVPEFTIDLSLFETPAQWIMEGGEILPEPGEEALCEWLQNGHQETQIADDGKAA